MHLRGILRLIVNPDASVFSDGARKTEGPDRSHIRGGKIRTMVACTSSRYIKDGCKSERVGFPDVLRGVIALGISYGDVWKHNAIHYFAHPIGRAVEKRRRCISSWGVSEYRSEKNPSPMLECAKIDVNRGRSKYMSKKDRPLG